MPESIIVMQDNFSLAVFTIEFTEDDYSYVEGDPNARVCLEGIGEIAQPATATVSSLAQGTATGYIYLPWCIYVYVGYQQLCFLG